MPSFLVHSLLKRSSFLVLDQFSKNLVRTTTKVGLNLKNKGKRNEGKEVEGDQRELLSPIITQFIFMFNLTK